MWATLEVVIVQTFEKCVFAQPLLLAFVPERSVPLSSNIYQVRLDSESMLWSLGSLLVSLVAHWGLCQPLRSGMLLPIKRLQKVPACYGEP